MKSFKLKRFSQAIPTAMRDMMQGMLMSKIKESDIDDYFDYEGICFGKCTSLSFDSSVCENFDALPLHSEYWNNLKKLSFKNLEKEAASEEITFG